ncbi:YbaK/EbsC family protein [Nakamurella deserti]|uniref:YbaK/EbsC family protein n=1 Tax=Nakamurella deserti TaxID=2164074 RepID=UPI000DBE6A3D|nr:YbaK/EbsC family protein [Nakamurella deserti]
MTPTLGSLHTVPALDRPDLLAPSVPAALRLLGADVGVAEIDPDLADTAAFCAAHGVPAAASANCVVLIGKREGTVRYAAAVVLATTRADVNGVIRRLLDVRKISLAPMDVAVELTGMEYGGITPLGLPADWPVLVDGAVAAAGPVVVGSGLRRSKMVLDGALLGSLPTAQVVASMATPIPV